MRTLFSNVFWGIIAFVQMPFMFFRSRLEKKFPSMQMWKFLKRADLHPLTKLELLYDRVEGYTREVYSYKNMAGWKVHDQMKNIIDIALSIRNMFAEVKVLTGMEDAKKLIGLLEKGAKKVYFFKTNNLVRSSFGCVLQRTDGTYVSYSSSLIGKKRLLKAEPNDESAWWPGTKRGLSVEEIRTIYQNMPTSGNWRRLWDFSTGLTNRCCTEPSPN